MWDHDALSSTIKYSACMIMLKSRNTDKWCYSDFLPSYTDLYCSIYIHRVMLHVYKQPIKASNFHSFCYIYILSLPQSNSYCKCASIQFSFAILLIVTIIPPLYIAILTYLEFCIRCMWSALYFFMVQRFSCLLDLC